MAIKIVTSRDYKFEPIDEGVYEAIVTDLEERQEANNFKGGELRDVIKTTFTIQSGLMKDKNAYFSFNPNISPKSRLFVFCKAVLGREFSVEELAAISDENGFEMLKGLVLNKQLMIVVKNKVSARGNTYYFVSDFLKSSATPVSQPALEETPPSPVAETPVNQDEISRIAKEVEEEAGSGTTVAKATPKPSR